MSADNNRTREAIFFSSAFSSITSTLITNPIQVAKTNLQYYPLACPQYPHTKFKQLIACTCSNFSFKGSLKSLKVVLPQVTISNILYMQIYQNRVQCFRNKLNYSITSATLCSVLIARTIVSTIMLPLQILRIRLSNDIKAEGSIFNFKGFKVTLMRDLSYSLLFWLTLQNVRNYFTGSEYRERVKASKHTNQQIFRFNLLPALITGSIISAITTPIDTVKTRLQSSAKTNPSIIRQMANIYKKQKLLGLFAGVHFRVLKNSVHSSLYISLFEFTMNRIVKNSHQ